MQRYTLLIALLLAALLLSGCGKTWILKYEPTTDAERKAITEHVEKVMAATPRTLSGHDQDWDDAIKMADTQARETICRPTLWEWSNGPQQFTGRWRYATEVQHE